MKDDGYRFEEMDDPRTIGDVLTPDCERGNSLPFGEEVCLPVFEYLNEFKTLIRCCGKVAYNHNMIRDIKDGVSKAIEVSSKYHHDLSYYEKQKAKWKGKTERSYAILSFYAGRFGFDVPEKRYFLNVLTLSKDRRKAYNGYLDTCLDNKKAISPTKLEYKYYQLLEKRMGRG